MQLSHPRGTLTRPGEFLVSDPKHAKPEPARAYLIDDDTITSHAREQGINQVATGTDPKTPLPRLHNGHRRTNTGPALPIGVLTPTPCCSRWQLNRAPTTGLTAEAWSSLDLRRSSGRM